MKIEFETDQLYDIEIQTLKYLQYIINHRDNVRQAWNDIKVACENMPFITDDTYYNVLCEEIRKHDLSKYSAEEFTQYRQRFYPTWDEMNEGLHSEKYLDKAWKHHLDNNSHHFENIANIDNMVDLVHMLCDLLAMSKQFKQPHREYYDKNKETFKVKDWQHERIEEIYTALDQYYEKCLNSDCR